MGGAAGRTGGNGAVDGKAAKRSFERQAERRPLHRVDAWAVEQSLVLGRSLRPGGAQPLAPVSLDVVIDEDGARSRKDHGAEHLARLRRCALDLLRANPDKGSTPGKIERAGWHDAFLLKILSVAQCDCPSPCRRAVVDTLPR